MHTLMDIVSIKMSGEIPNKGNSAQYSEKISEYAFSMDTQRLFEITDAFCKTYGNKTADKLLSFQAMLIELACTQSTITLLLERVAVLEDTVAELRKNGVSVASEHLVSSMEESSPQGFTAENEVSTDNFTPEEFPPFPDIDMTDKFMPCPDMDLDIPADLEAGFVSIADDVDIPFPSTDYTGDDELRALGLNVVSQAPVFEEEILDDAVLSCEDTLTGDNSAVAVASEPSQSANVSGESEASFFDEFARLFGISQDG